MGPIIFIGTVIYDNSNFGPLLGCLWIFYLILSSELASIEIFWKMQMIYAATTPDVKDFGV